MENVKKALVDLLEQGIAEKVFSGAAFAVGSDSQTVFGYAGGFTYDHNSPRIDEHSLWDMASVTKVIATTSAAMLLVDSGALRLERRVQDYVPSFTGEGKECVKVRDLLLHESGLPAYADLTSCATPDEGLAKVLSMGLEYETGTRTVYSCLGFITLRAVLESIAGEPLDAFLNENLLGPLCMDDSVYNPSVCERSRCVPTESTDDWRKRVEDQRGFVRVQEEFIQGDVHDPAAFVLGGVSGNAGLFSCPKDVATVLQMLLMKGANASRQILSSKTVDEWTRRNSPRSTRGLGWDTKSPEGSSSGAFFSPNSFGHTGFTGTSVWVDPDRRIFAALFTNRVHPTSENLLLTDFRPRFHDAFYLSMSGS